MKEKLKKALVVMACFMLIGAFNSVDAATSGVGQNIGVTVDNSLVVVPGAPAIISTDNITTNSVDVLVEVENTVTGFANEVLDYVLTITNVVSGDVTSVNYTQVNDANAHTTLDVVGLDPGTEYEFHARYARPGGVYSGESNVVSITTLINAPVLNSVDNVTTESADLNVSIDPSFVGSSMDFIIEVSGDDGTYTIQMTRNITSSNLLLNVDSLDPGKEYTFKVKYGREGSMNFSDYSNSKTIITEDNAVKLVDPEIKGINNITTSSIDLDIEVSDIGDADLDFVVHVTNETTGDTFTVDFSKTMNDGETTLGITGLDPGTEYTFKVKYSLDGEDDESDYSNSVTATTDTVDVPDPTVEICSDGTTIIVLQAELQTYLDQGATVGPCTTIVDKKIIICHKNKNTISVAQSALQAHLDHGDSIGACPISGGSTDVIEEEEVEQAIVEEDETGKILGIIEKKKVKDVIAPEESKKTYQKVAAAGAVAGTAAALASSSIPLFAAMPGAFSSSIFLQFLELFGIIGRRKEEKNWGTVFDSDTKIPIPAVKIVLLDTMGKEMATTYSDKDGRFGFLVNPGNYIINVEKKNYKLITDDLSDELYGNIYNGGEVEIDENYIMHSNIAMKSENINWEEYADKKSKQYNSKWSIFKKYFFSSIYFIGFTATIVITYFYPSIFNFVVLGIYVALFIFQKFFKKKKYGLVETSDGKPIPFAVVNLYQKDTNAKEGFAVTDSIGRYYLLANNGKYDLKAKGQPISGKQFEKSGEVKVKDGILRKDIIV